MAFLGFGCALIIGLVVENPFVTVVLRGLAAMAVFYCLGAVLASLGQRAIQENFEQYTQEQQQQSQLEEMAQQITQEHENQQRQAQTTAAVS